MMQIESAIKAESQRVVPMVYAMVNQEDAEDVLQDIRLSLYQALPNFRGEGKLANYARSIARRRIADYYRTKYQDCHFVTEREKAVLRLVGRGLNNEEISKILCISLNTIRTYLKSVYKKLQCRDRVTLALFAYKIFKE